MSLLHDLRYAGRGLAKSPAIAAILVITAGIGTGANTMVFSLVDALLFRAPPGVVQPSRLAMVYTSEPGGQPYGYSSYPDFLAIKADAPSFAAFAAMDDTSTVGLRVGDALYSVRVGEVSPEFFSLLGVRAALGDLFATDVDGEATPLVASFKFWRRVFSSKEDAIGATVVMNGRQYVVVGVAPDGFGGLRLGRDCDVWIPLTESTLEADRGNRRLSLVGRLRPSATLAVLRREVAAAARRLADEHPRTNRGTANEADEPRALTVLRYSRLDPVTSSRTTLIGFVLFGATELVLMSACANGAGLLLSRGAHRAREIAVRLALGASRRRLVQQLLAESFVVAILGAALGLLMSHWSASVFPSFFVDEQAELLDPRLDVQVFMFALALSVVSGALFGLAPALLSTRPIVVAALRSDPGGTARAVGGARLRALLAVAQIALSVVLLVATMQLVRGLTTAFGTEMSTAIRRTAVFSVLLPGRYANEARGVRYQWTAREQVMSLPGVEAAAWVSMLPLETESWRLFRIERRETGLTEYAELQSSIASDAYFPAMNIPLLAGRMFDARDNGLSPPVVVVNDVLASRYFGTPKLAQGQHLTDTSGTEFEIVGVVQSVRYRTLQPAPPPVAYHAAAQRYVSRMHLIVRTTSDPETLIDPIRTLLQNVDTGVELMRATTLDARLSEALAMERLTTVLVGACGTMSLVLALVGVYGVMADGVMRRMRELGVRVALGARPAAIVQLVFGYGLKLAIAGVTSGMILALVGSRLLDSIVQGIAPVDARLFITIPVLLALMVLVACMIPIRRAVRVNPTVVLREE